MIEITSGVVVVTTDPRTGRKEIRVDGVLVAVLHPPKEGGSW